MTDEALATLWSDREGDSVSQRLFAALMVTLASAGLLLTGPAGSAVAAPPTSAAASAAPSRGEAASASASGAPASVGGSAGSAATSAGPQRVGSPTSMAQALRTAGATTTSGTVAKQNVQQHRRDRVCSLPVSGHVACNLEHAPAGASSGSTGSASSGSVSAAVLSPTPGSSGLRAQDIRNAYALPSSAALPGSGPVVAAVDAFDDPNIEADVNAYRQQWGLGTCSKASGCLTVITQTGSTDTSSVPSGVASGWNQESEADLEMVSAVCPQCRLLLVEANSTDINDVGSGVNAAVAYGAKYISNSYGTADPGSTTESEADQLYYQHPGVVVTASAGDNGYGAEYPADSPYVTAVGGTTLTASSPSTWVEQAWSDGGSGCGSEAASAWQTGTGCSTRSSADVSAVAYGVLVYASDSTSNGWGMFGGTSLSSPIIAATYALAATTTGSAGPAPSAYPVQWPYQRVSGLNDIVSGSNGTCSVAVQCTAGPGYDGPTGLGSPHGITAFEQPTVTNVQRVAGADAFDTAAQTAALGNYSPGLPKVYVATRANFPDALSGGPAAGVDGAPVLLVLSDSVPTATQNELATLHPQQIVILGGTAVITSGVESTLARYASDTAQPTVREAGDTRWATSATISANTFPQGASNVYIATGLNFPDALSGAAIAATLAHRGPVLLVPGTSIPQEIQSELNRLRAASGSPLHVYVLGGVNAVSADVASQLAQWGSVARVSGSSRYETSAALAALGYSTARTVYVATGTNFPDALAGAPVAARNGAPVLLVQPTQTPAVVQDEIAALGATNVIVLGGTAAVADSAVATL